MRVGHQSIFAPERRADAAALAVLARSSPTRVGFLSFGSRSATLETWIGPSFSITPPPLGPLGVADLRGRLWRLMMFRPST